MEDNVIFQRVMYNVQIWLQFLSFNLNLDLVSSAITIFSLVFIVNFSPGPVVIHLLKFLLPALGKNCLFLPQKTLSYTIKRYLS